MRQPNPYRTAGGSVPRPMHNGGRGSQYGSCSWGPRHAGEDGVLQGAATTAVGLQKPLTIPAPPPSPFDSPEPSWSFVSFSLFITPPASPPPSEVSDESDNATTHEPTTGTNLTHPKRSTSATARLALPPPSAAMSTPSNDGGAASPERRPLLAGTASDEPRWDRTAASNRDGRAVAADGNAGNAGNADAEERVVGGGAGTFTRNLGAVEAFAIVISIVIGSGVFTSPGSIDTNVPSPGAALLVWLVGGVLAWTGASTMAELGTAIPGEGMFDAEMVKMEPG